MSDLATIGEYVTLCVDVNIGQKGGAAPNIGNCIYISPGAKLFGAIEVADHIQIGANAVVNKSFTEEGISIAGVPARKVSDNGWWPET